MVLSNLYLCRFIHLLVVYISQENGRSKGEAAISILFASALGNNLLNESRWEIKGATVVLTIGPEEYMHMRENFS